METCLALEEDEYRYTRTVWTVALLLLIYAIIGTVLLYRFRSIGHGVFWVFFLLALLVSVSIVALHGACFFYYLALGIGLLLTLYWMFTGDTWAVVANFITAVLLVVLTYKYCPLAAILLLVYPIWMLYAFWSPL